jgi:hypothetical protein
MLRATVSSLRSAPSLRAVRAGTLAFFALLIALNPVCAPWPIGGAIMLLSGRRAII